MASKTLTKKEYLDRLVAQTLAVIRPESPAIIEVVKKAIENAYSRGAESAKQK